MSVREAEQEALVADVERVQGLMQARFPHFNVQLGVRTFKTDKLDPAIYLSVNGVVILELERSVESEKEKTVPDPHWWTDPVYMFEGQNAWGTITCPLEDLTTKAILDHIDPLELLAAT